VLVVQVLCSTENVGNFMLYENGMNYTQIITAKHMTTYISSATCNLHDWRNLWDLTVSIRGILVYFILSFKYHATNA
jgi:phage portal protein BeeE